MGGETLTYFLVTWMDGQFESYPSVPAWEIRDGVLSLNYHEETHLIPLTSVRSIKMEKA